MKKLKELRLIDMNNLYEYENKLYDAGINYIAGVDEVGRGPLVGPVVASAVILPKGFFHKDIKDSKKLSEKKRDYLYDVIMANAISVGIGIISNERIDEINIYEATKEAMLKAINNLSIKPDHVLIDAMHPDLDIPSTSIIKGDAKSESIAAASIIAKVTRDKMMYELDETYPMYDFKHNKGYPTKTHLAALQKYGIISLHRKSYKPVSDVIKIDNLKK
ncbi:MAG TPA: ribonuclease HII [Bacilli bacterium]|nr:ribonuclease HII [Bacilli bacterium]